MNQMIANKVMNDEEEEEEEDIIINEEFSDDEGANIGINALPASLDKAKVIEDQPIVNKEKNQSPSQNQSQSITEPPIQAVDTRDIHVELPSSSKLIYQEKEVSLEEEYINKIKRLTKENNEIKKSNVKLEKEIKEQIEEIRTNNELIDKEQKKLESESSMKLKLLIEECEMITQKTSQLEEVNLSLTRQVNNYKAEYDKFQHEISIKDKKIEELNKKINHLESKPLTQKISNDNEAKQNSINLELESIGECNRALSKAENELSIAIDKIHQLTNENYKLKQALSKSRLPTPIHIGNPNQNGSRIFNENNKEIEIDTTLNQQRHMKHSKSNSEVKLNQSPNNALIKKQTASNFHLSSHLTDHLYSNQLETAMKESKILEIETTLYKLQKERDKLSEELARLPEYPKHKNVINKKRNLEISINDYNTKISANKQRINEIKAEANDE